MLLNLTVRDVVLIKHLEMNFYEGLTVLTGETGAGKSILLDSLGLALGMRGDAGLVRQGADRALVTAEFSLEAHNAVTALLEEHAIECEGTLVLRRVLMKNGRSRAFINDQAVSVTLLKRIGCHLIEIHGQFDQLLDPVAHRSFLDAYAEMRGDRALLVQYYDRWKACDVLLLQAQERDTLLRENEDLYRYQLDELNQLEPQAQEEQTLLRERTRLAQGEKTQKAIHNSLSELGHALSSFHATSKELTRIEAMVEGEAVPARQALERAEVEVNEALTELERFGRTIHSTPQRLLELDDRLHLLREIARKHRVLPDVLVEVQAKLKQDLESLDQSSEALETLEQEVSQARASYLDCAKKISQKRQEAAKNLQQAVLRELPALKLNQAHFEVSVDALEEAHWGREGMDHIAFMVAMNKGQPLSSLQKTASGGERSRLMLALKAALAGQSPISLIVFDEIDAGVGGSVATALGKRLSALSQHMQVVVITHSPQVASQAAQHYRIVKEEKSGHMETQIHCLPEGERREELARMLAGDTVTDEARLAADKLIQAQEAA